MCGYGLKALEKITSPEGCSLSLHYISEGQEAEPLSLELYHRLVASLALGPPVNQVIHTHFDIARNLLLYAWFEASFMQPAELQAFASLELGLRMRIGHGPFRGPGLAKLLREAVERGLLMDEHLGPYPCLTGFGRAWSREHGVRVPGPEAGPARAVGRYVEVLCDAIPAVRNRLAHGRPGWVGTGFATLSTCRDLLNHLAPFVGDEDAQSAPRTRRITSVRREGKASDNRR